MKLKATGLWFIYLNFYYNNFKPFLFNFREIVIIENVYKYPGPINRAKSEYVVSRIQNSRDKVVKERGKNIKTKEYQVEWKGHPRK
jgi:hypothetical protein